MLEDMRIFLHIVIVFAAGFLLYQLWNQYLAWHAIDRKLTALEMKLTPLERENGRIGTDLKALETPDAVLRELRRAGYAAPGEKVIVIVPKK
jgi:cell division protein FtsB